MYSTSGDDDAAVRRQGLKYLHQIMRSDEEFRSVGNAPPSYQQYFVPKIDFNAAHYSEMITFQQEGHGHTYYEIADFYGKGVRPRKQRVTVPPILKNKTRAELIDFLRRPLRTEYLNHSQPCERGVATTSQACCIKLNGQNCKQSYEAQLTQALLAERSRRETPAPV